MKTFFKKNSLLAVAFIVGVSVGVFIATFKNSVISTAQDYDTSVAVPLEDKKIQSFVTSTSTPQRLIIPTISIDAYVQLVGISKHATMAVPNNFTDVGWYRYGSIPGQSGNAVFAGHLDNGLGLAGVFKHIQDLEAGDDIYIVLSDSTKVHFQVSSTEIIPEDTLSTENIFATTGPSHLKIITCDGVWNQALKTYSNRRVVTADFVGS